MIKQLEKAINKVSKLSELEQEMIAQMILTTIESHKQSANGGDTLKEMTGSIEVHENLSQQHSHYLYDTPKQNKKDYIEDDPLAELRNSDFIGCFADEADLAEKSEQIAQDTISKKV